MKPDSFINFAVSSFASGFAVSSRFESGRLGKA
jgi:hypothetical protein